MIDPHPVFVVVSTARQADATIKRLRAHGPAVRVATPGEAVPVLRGHARCLALLIDGDVDVAAVRSLYASVPHLAGAPALWTSTERPACDPLPPGCRWIPRSAPRAETRYFLGFALALEVSGRPLVAAATEALGRERGLTERQMELTAISTLAISREDLATGLAVSTNTLKTRVRQLLRLHQLDTFDALGKAVLRVAVDLSSDANDTRIAPTIPRPPRASGMLPAERRPAADSRAARAAAEAASYRPEPLAVEIQPVASSSASSMR